MVQVSNLAEWCARGELPSADEFFAALIDDDDRFTSLEGGNWDFKDEWPFSHTNDYFAGICRLCCAFANSSGGIIVFGVHDAKRTGGHNKVRPNLDKFLAAFRELTGAEIELDFHAYDHPKHGAVDALMVKPRKTGTDPIRFRRSLGKYQAGVFWVRNGHEVVAAAPNHFPMLFCRAHAAEHAPERDGSIPPSPATLKRFVGRIEVLDRLFNWLSTSDEPRTYLYGKGGSGKTTIAYEFARLVKDYGEHLRIEGDDEVDVVLFLSAKEKQLVPASAQIETIEEPDFSDEASLLRQVLYYGGWTTNREALEQDDLAALRAQVKDYFDITSAVIVLDDIDTLTTKGVDPGSDFLYRTLCRSKRKSRVLYTLRNAPTQSLHSSIEVPGLQGTDYEEFVAQCATQFGVKHPKPEFRDGRLADISERRPLVIESIVALVRTAMDYDRAADLFAQHAGDNVRDYVFSREWDALVGDELPRLLLAALADLNRSVTYADLQTVLQADESRVRDAVGRVREMFLQIDEAGQDVLFALAPLTRSFVGGRKTTLRGSGRIKERVRAFKQSVRLTSPAVTAVVTKVHRLMPLRYLSHLPDKVLEAWRVVSDPALPEAITEDPVFKCAYGYVCANLNPPRLSEAREAFQDAVNMRQEPAFGELRSWFQAERGSGTHDGWQLKIADLVINGRSYTELEKIHMISRKGTSLYARAQERLFTDQVDAQKDLGDAVVLHLRAFKLNSIRGDAQMDVSEEYARNTARQWLEFALRDAPWELFDRVRHVVSFQELFLDPLHRPLIEMMRRINRMPLRGDAIHRLRNKMKGIVELLGRREDWLDPTVSRQVQDEIRGLERNLLDRLKTSEAPAGASAV